MLLAMHMFWLSTIVKNVRLWLIVSGEWSALKSRYVHTRELMNHIDMYFEGRGGNTSLCGATWLQLSRRFYVLV